MKSWSAYFERRPILVTLAGSNGAGKSTFYETFLRSVGLRFVNADILARDLEIDASQAGGVTTAIRDTLIRQRESFVFETVFSDPKGDKLAFLKRAAEAGYAVVLCFIGVADANTSEQRVAIRVSQGGHDVPREKLLARFPRTLANLSAAIPILPCVLIFDNGDLRTPFRYVAAFVNGRIEHCVDPLPSWLVAIL